MVTEAIQKAIRARLIASPAVVTMVPVDNIMDRNQRPAPDPAIVLGEVQAIEDGQDNSRRRSRVFHTIHIWKKEPSLAGAAAIAGAVRLALHFDRLDLGAGFHCVDSHVSTVRTMRDPDGETSHAVVTVEIMAQEVVT